MSIPEQDELRLDRRLSLAWPPPPDDLRPYPAKVTRHDQRVDVFGDAIRDLRLDGTDPVPGGVQRVPDYRLVENREWRRQHITTVEIPQLEAIRTPFSRRIPFHEVGAKALKELWQEWDDLGLLSRIYTFHGSYVARFSKGSKPGESGYRKNVSNHAFGTAFDINKPQNDINRIPAPFGQNGSVRELVRVANRHGFFWGGHYKNTRQGWNAAVADGLDGMHFELGIRSEAVAPHDSGTHAYELSGSVHALAAASGMISTTLLEHGSNRELRDARTDQAFHPDDMFEIPEVRQIQLDVESQEAHRFEFGERAVARLELLHRGQLVASRALNCSWSEGSSDLQSDADGRVEIPLPTGVTRVTIEFCDDQGGVVSVLLNVGGLAPIQTLSGMLNRLRNLGYMPIGNDYSMLTSFCIEHGIDPADVGTDRFIELLKRAAQTSERA